MTQRVFSKNLLTWSFLFRYLSNYALYHLSLIPIFLLFHSYNQIKAIRIKMIIVAPQNLPSVYFYNLCGSFQLSSFSKIWILIMIDNFKKGLSYSFEVGLLGHYDFLCRTLRLHTQTFVLCLSSSLLRVSLKKDAR